jgi:flagellar protein FliO/FliZ
MKQMHPSPRRAHALPGLALLVTGLLHAGLSLAGEAQAPLATGGLAAGDLASAGLRMVLGLAAVLALLGATAWVSRRFRVSSRLRGGLIEVVSGISLGARERVVLLRVGSEQVLVGLSPNGMRTLHVLGTTKTDEFSNYLERNP